MPDILMRLGREVLVVEGAMGTMLQRAGLPAGECPEFLNVTAPDMVAGVHKLYRLAGADCCITNTFGGSRPKLDEYGLGDRVEELNRAAVRIASQYGAPHVLADVGPSGKVLEPLGETTFDELFDVYAEQIAALAAEAPDAILIETMTDIAEARCAVLAARSVTELPVIATVTIGSAGRMDLSGTDAATAAVILEAAGASAVGVNCGLGPEQMLPLLEEMAEATALPLIVQPNAGMPVLNSVGETIFPGTPDEFYEWAGRAADAGAAMIGSCCGSTPAFTAEIAAAVSDRDVVERPARSAGVVLAGPRSCVRIGGAPDAPVRVIGERINPTGKPQLAAELAEGRFSLVRSFAIEQQQAGADLLDVHVGAAGVDEVAVLPAAVLA
ncbi:MAG: homocysteine S-methyltransferase family protein, partial [Coriobacteriales bacterium]|nr:homocysteine S-methyltransferase family protein [Coriobacteriales bacterium]